MQKRVESYLRGKYNIDISAYNHSFLKKSISIRMNLTSCDTLEDYLLYLGNIPDEVPELMWQMNNSYSEFFRNPLTFTCLEQIILPQLLENKKIKRENEIRIWSAACASGQEAYSLAILCDELMKPQMADINCRIFATDMNPDEISNAQMGVYQAPALGKVTLNRIQTYFTRKGGTYTIVPRLKESIDFSVFDLVSGLGSSPPASIYGNFDLVFCSNLLFYYKPESRNAILEKIGNSLDQDGYIVTGETEREIVRQNNYREVLPYSAIFQRR